MEVYTAELDGCILYTSLKANREALPLAPPEEVRRAVERLKDGLRGGSLDLVYVQSC